MNDIGNPDTMCWEIPQPARPVALETHVQRRKYARCACQNAANLTSLRLADLLAKRFGFRDCTEVAED